MMPKVSGIGADRVNSLSSSRYEDSFVFNSGKNRADAAGDESISGIGLIAP